MKSTKKGYIAALLASAGYLFYANKNEMWPFEPKDDGSQGETTEPKTTEPKTSTKPTIPKTSTKPVSTDVNARKVRAKQISTVMATGKKVLTWTDNTAKLKLYQKDLLGVYQNTGKVLSVTKGSQITVIGSNTLTDGMMRFSYQYNGIKYFYASPFSVTIL